MGLDIWSIFVQAFFGYQTEQIKTCAMAQKELPDYLETL